jgi:glutamine amidotransferase
VRDPYTWIVVVSHLVAYFGNEPENMACALFSARSALYSRGSKGLAGIGLGFVQGGDVLLQKRPRAETAEVDLYGLIKDLRADALVGRVMLAHDGNATAEDADPFRFRSWLFGSVGEVSATGFENVREKMLESIPSFLRRNIRGKSPSEHIFHLFLAFLHDAGILDLPSPSPAAVHGALRNSVSFLDRLLAGTGSESIQLALVATNGRCFVATSCAYPLRYLNVEGISDCPVCHGRVDVERDGRRIPHEGLRAVILEANRQVERRAGWHEMPDRSALIIGADRVPHVSSL